MKKYFEQFDDILEAVVITDKTTGRSKGYGFADEDGVSDGEGSFGLRGSTPNRHSRGSPSTRGRGRGGRGSGRPRAPSGNGFAPGEYEDGGFETNRGYGRGRDEVGVAVFVGVGGLRIMVLRWIPSRMLKATIKKHHERFATLCIQSLEV